MFKKISSITLSVLFGILSFSHLSYGEQKVTTTEATTTQTTTTPSSAKKVTPVTTVTTSNTSATVVKNEPNARTVLDEETLKKMSSTLCTEGFKTYVGSDKRNICQSQATAPDLAYSCVWDKDGSAAYAPTPQGPCNLDFTEHRGSIIITKTDFTNPPLAYGVEAQCCFRAAQDSKTAY